MSGRDRQQGTAGRPITIMGAFVVDLVFRTRALPRWGETVLGSEFRMGPGGKGSNQAVAAARLGAKTWFLGKVGGGPFREVARRIHEEAGVDGRFLVESNEHSMGAAAILVDEGCGQNAIIVSPGAANALTVEEIDAAAEAIASSAVFMTQLELPLTIVEHGLQLARRLGVTTILNPAPACALPLSLLALCDVVTPNESEAATLTGLQVDTLEQAEAAAQALLAMGARSATLTLGERGVLVKTPTLTQHIPARTAGPVVDTTGAGDAFNGGLAAAIAEGLGLVEAARFGCAVAGISVTREGTAPSMPWRAEVESLLAREA